MNPVSENPQLPPSAVRSMQNVSMFCGAMVRTLGQWTQRAGYRLNRMFPKDGTEAMVAPLPLAIYTAATKPDATLWKGALIYVSDGSSPYVYASNGTSWILL